MVSKLHLTLGILLSGFMIEGVIEGYTYVSRSYDLPYSALIFLLGPFVTLFGLLFLWIGRVEWNELLSKRFRHAHRTFWYSILAIALAISPALWYGYQSTEPIPSWVSWEFGAAIMLSLLLTYATYVLIAFELTGTGGKAILLLAFGWATLIAFFIAHALSQEFGRIVSIIQTRVLSVSPINESVAGFESYLSVTYLLMLIAYLDAYRRLLSGSESHLKPEFRRKTQEPQ